MSIAIKSNDQRIEILEEEVKKLRSLISYLRSEVERLDKCKEDRIVKYGARRGR